MFALYPVNIPGPVFPCSEALRVLPAGRERRPRRGRGRLCQRQSRQVAGQSRNQTGGQRRATRNVKDLCTVVAKVSN